MKTFTSFSAFCTLAIPSVLAFPIRLPGAVNIAGNAASRLTIPGTQQPCSALLADVARGRGLLDYCDSTSFETSSYFAERRPSSHKIAKPSSLYNIPKSKSLAMLPNPAIGVESPNLALNGQLLDALLTPPSTSPISTSKTSSTISISLPPSGFKAATYTERIRLEDVIARRDLSAFFDWLAARPIMAWTLIIAVLIIVSFVTAVIVEIVAALRNAINKRCSSPSDYEQQLDCGDRNLSGLEKWCATVIVTDHELSDPRRDSNTCPTGCYT